MGLLSAIFPDRKKKFLTKIDQAIDKVKHGTYNYLYMDLLESYDNKKAGMIAAALTNILFNEKPVGKEAIDFCEKNRELIEKEKLGLKGNETIGNMVSDAVQTKANLIFNNQKSGVVDMNFGKSLDIMKELGFYKHPDRVAKPKLFFVKADKYFSISLKKVKYL